MVLTPLDIQNKIFPTKIRGYDQVEVDEFLDLVVWDYVKAIQRNYELEKAFKQSKEKLNYFNELKETLIQSIIVAQNTADKVKITASKESKVIVNAAQNKATELVANAEKRRQQLLSDAEEKAQCILIDATERAIQLAIETNYLEKKMRVFQQQISLMFESQLEQVIEIHNGPVRGMANLQKIF